MQSTDSNDNEEKRNSAVVLSTLFSFKLLDCMVTLGKPVRITELAIQLKESKAKVHRYLNTMRMLGVVEQERTSDKYRLGWKLFQLGQAALDQFDLKSVAEPFMAQLRDLSRQSVVLAVPSGGEAMIIHNLDYNAPGILKISAVPGSIAPATASAQGRIMLAYATKKQQQQLMTPPLRSYNKNTLTNLDKIKMRLELIRKRLYEISFEEVMLGISTVAAPIFNAEEKLIGSVGILGSIQYIPNPPHPQQIAQVHICAAGISRKFNSTSSYAGIVNLDT